jgi:serine/threonine-protein kinase
LQQLGRYQILKELANGGIADVYLARATGLEGFTRHVVLKSIRRELAAEPRFVTAFLEEARIAASLHHHNIVQVYDIGEQNGAYFFAMEYVHSEDVRTLLNRVRERNEVVPLDQAVSIMTATAAGLHYAHEAVSAQGVKLGVVHRDVAPSNILVGYDGSVKLVDFGLAKAALRSTTTAAGTIRGKASYMSPEQCRGEKIDRRADIFGLGIVMYELITAQRLFKGTTDFDTMQAVVEGDVPPPSSARRDVPPALDAIILRALAKDPNARYQTAEAFRAAVETFGVEHQLRTSNKALADYVVKLFGQRPEPWEANDVKPVTEDTAVGERGVVQPRSSRSMPVAQEVIDEVDLDDDDATFNGEAATTVVPESVQFAARLMGEEPTAMASAATMQPLLHAMTTATGTATTVTRATTQPGTSATVAQRRMKSDTAEDKTTVGAPIFEEEDARPRPGAATDVHVPAGKRMATPRAGTDVAAAPPPPMAGRSSSPHLGALPSAIASTHGAPRPPSTPPQGSPSSQYSAQYGSPSSQFNAQAPFETSTPSGQSIPSQYPTNPADFSLSKFAPWRRALAHNRSTILIGGAAGIAIIVVAILVLRACGG